MQTWSPGLWAGAVERRLMIDNVRREEMPAYTVTFMFDGRLMKEIVSCTTPDAARKMVEARYPGCQVRWRRRGGKGQSESAPDEQD